MGSKLAPVDVELIRKRMELTSEQIRKHRDDQCEFVETRMRELQQSGKASQWLADADQCVQTISRRVNGPLSVELMEIANHHDIDCANLFREGAKLAEEFDDLGKPRTKNRSTEMSKSVLAKMCKQRNDKNDQLCQTRHTLMRWIWRSARMFRTDE